jgi:hypothetical protein
VAENRNAITVSIVSHGQAELVSRLLAELARFTEVARVILTVNVPDAAFVLPAGLEGRIVLVENQAPKGFGANHNSAFALCDSGYFCVLNPDICLFADPFPPLLAALKTSGVAFAAPLILNPDGEIEDSARFFPTPWSLLLRLMRLRDARYPLSKGALVHPDWIAGMFMLFHAADFRALAGFDEQYFLYCEDIDICARLRRAGGDFVLCPSVRAVHDARRSSHKNLRYMKLHVASLVRFFLNHLGRLPRTRG